ncbi:hypothetical protein [Bacillus sp. FJAT-18017]|jgi:hypothetical protein|nr:hypothetical protein [Bacillus sp. FJAT-18017]
MGRRSRRFVKQGSDSVSRHSQRIPYHMTFAEAEERKLADNRESSNGGI